MRRLPVWLVLLLTAVFCSFVSSIMELDLDRVEQTDGFDRIDARLIRVRKYNRTTPVINGSVFYKQDIDNQYRMSIRLAYSRLGNNQFTEYPMKISERSFCDYLNTTYREYNYLFINNSNFPPVPPEGICPLPKGEYWLKDVLVPTSFIPRFVPEGYWRFTMIGSGPGDYSFIWVFYARMVKEDTLLG